MKSKLAFAVLIFISSFISCKKDSNDNKAALIIGTWNLKTTTYETRFSGKLTETNAVDVEKGTVVLEFKEDGTLIRKEKDKQPEIGGYSLNDDNTSLHTQFENISGSVEIRRLTSNELLLVQEWSYPSPSTEVVTNLLLLTKF